MIENNKDYDEKRLQQLLDSFADDTLTEADEDELQSILKGSKEARLTYLEFTQMVDSLHWSYAENAVAMDDLAPTETPHTITESKDSVKFPLWNLVAFAAVITISFIAFYTTSAPDVSIGEFTASSDTVLKHKLEQGRIGPEIIEMDSGKATLHLDSGATLEMSGKVKLQLISSLRAKLLEGSVTIDAPDSAMGFRLETNASDFVDIGTKFEVSVEDRASKVRVIDGTVIARPNNGGNIIPFNKNEEGTINSIYGDLVNFKKIEAKNDGLPNSTYQNYSPLPEGSRVVFLGDRNTDFETYIHMVNQSIYDANPDKLPKLINAGMTCRLIFEDDEFKDLVLDMNPTHAVLAFGAEIAGSVGEKEQYRIPVDEYSGYIKRMCDKLEENNIEPIILIPFYQVTSDQKCVELLDAYNKVVRELARTRGYRLAEADSIYNELEKRGAHTKLVNFGETFISYEGSKVMAKAVLQSFGFPQLQVPEKLRLRTAKGLVKNWQYFKYTAKRDPTPDLMNLGERNWQQMSLPLSQLSSADKKALLPYQGYQFQARSLGVSVGLNHHWQKTIAKSTVHSEAERKAFLNIGGDVKEVYLNGQRVGEFQGIYANGRHIGLYRLPVDLKKGENSIIIKSGISFFVSITDTKDWGLPLPKAVD
ncbi:MAG: hypothetical protein MK132_22445 [Lentisphaerales bacterium]|nr:hypothetical protein [Lentisphaerales bacterium]